MMCKCSGSEKKEGFCAGRVLAVIAGVLAFAGVVVLVCKLLSGRSENGGCPCRRLVSRVLHGRDENAADYAD